MKNLVLVLAMLFLTSCSITQQTYSFTHHGTESIKTDSNFKYCALNVMGKAKTTAIRVPSVAMVMVSHIGLHRLLM